MALRFKTSLALLYISPYSDHKYSERDDLSQLKAGIDNFFKFTFNVRENHQKCENDIK